MGTFYNSQSTETIDLHEISPVAYPLLANSTLSERGQITIAYGVNVLLSYYELKTYAW